MSFSVEVHVSYRTCSTDLHPVYRHIQFVKEFNWRFIVETKIQINK
jgi:hypothetical protein